MSDNYKMSDIWNAHDTARNKAWREEPGTFNTLDAFKAGAAWQAAQAVPVVGEPVAWLVDKPLRHVNMSKSTPIGLGNATQEPLYRAPTTSITEAECEKDAEV